MKIQISSDGGFSGDRNNLKFLLNEDQLEGLITSSVFCPGNGRMHFKLLDGTEEEIEAYTNSSEEREINIIPIVTEHTLSMNVRSIEEVNDSINYGFKRRLCIYEDGQLTMVFQYRIEGEASFLSGLKTGLELVYPEFDLNSVRYYDNEPFTLEDWNKIQEITV